MKAVFCMVKEYKRWLEIAESDLLTAKYLIGKKNILPAISIYHSHQCIEKSLKAVLANMQVDIPKVHNINFLLNKVAENIPDAIQYTDDCAALNEFLPKLRYPVGDKLLPDDAKECYFRAKKIFEFITGQI